MFRTDNQSGGFSPRAVYRPVTTMTETSADLPIQPELIADGQSLAKELNISWAGLVTLALRDFIRRYRRHKGLIDQINLAYSDGFDDEETQLIQAMQSSHRHLLEGEW